MLSKVVHLFAASLGVLVCIFMLAATVSAISVSESEVSSTLSTISVSSATNLYGYEVNLSYSGSIGDVTFAGFLGSSTASGSLTRGSYVYVYETKLDSNQTGVSGSGALFNLTHSGDLTVCGLLAVYASGSEERVSTGNCDSESGSTGGSTGGSGGGGGGGGTASSSSGGETYANFAEAASSLSFPVNEIIASVVSGRKDIREFILFNKGTKTLALNISSIGLNSILTIPASIIIKPGEQAVFNLNFETNERKLFVGQIIFSVGGIEAVRVPVIVNVLSEDFLFDSTISLSRRYRMIEPGDVLRAQFNLAQVDLSDEPVDVVATYSISDFEGNNYLEENETFAVIGSKEYVKEFFTNNLLTGKYVLGLEVTYPGAFASASAQFEVIAKRGLPAGILNFIFIAIFAGLFVLWFWTAHKRNFSKPPHARRRITRSNI